MKADNTELNKQPNQHLIAKRWFSELKHGEQLRLLSKYKKDVYNDYYNYYVSYADALHIYQSETSQAATPESVEQTVIQIGDKTLTELKKNKSFIFHQLIHKNEQISFNTGFHRGFEAGAKWQSEQSPSTIVPENPEDKIAYIVEQYMNIYVYGAPMMEDLSQQQKDMLSEMAYCIAGEAAKYIGYSVKDLHESRDGYLKAKKQYEEQSPSTCKESQGDVIDWENIKLSVNHIFESGANEIRVFELIKLYLNRYTPKQ